MAHLHARGIAHGSLTPSNIVLTMLNQGDTLASVYAHASPLPSSRIQSDPPAAPSPASASIHAEMDAASDQQRVDAVISDADAVFHKDGDVPVSMQGLHPQLEQLGGQRLWARVCDFGMSSLMGGWRLHGPRDVPHHEVSSASRR